jgi:hypothetical protein
VSEQRVSGSGAAAEGGGVAAGQGGTAVGRDYYGSVTNIYNLYTQAPMSIAQHIRGRDFLPLIENRTRNFVGRDFVFQAIDRALADPDFSAGYLVIRGQPGIGKTALMAQLVKQRGYVHHFNIAALNIRTPAQFLENVCAQLIVRYSLPFTTLPDRATQDGGFLTQLLADAAAGRQRASDRIVVLIDALDEAEDVNLPARQNRLFLPPLLPEGVIFIVTTRPMQDADARMTVVHMHEPLELRETDPQNLDDVRAYIRNFLATHADKMSSRLGLWAQDAESFVDRLTEKSQGNFMYLVYILPDIRDGRIDAQSIDDVERLPTGLRSYYAEHWSVMRQQDPERFERVYEPVVCTLAVVREPVTIAQLVDWSKQFTPSHEALPAARIRDVIKDWLQFLDEERDANNQPVYRVYHASFQDFLRAEVDLPRYDDAIAVAELSKIPGFLDNSS